MRKFAGIFSWGLVRGIGFGVVVIAGLEFRDGLYWPLALTLCVLGQLVVHLSYLFGGVRVP
jgi:hypothetical protein